MDVNFKLLFFIPTFISDVHAIDISSVTLSHLKRSPEHIFFNFVSLEIWQWFNSMFRAITGKVGQSPKKTVKSY